jgi:maltose O-acetyltransferase
MEPSMKKFYLGFLDVMGRLPGRLGAKGRGSWLRRSAGHCGEGVNILPGAFVGSPERLSIGANSGIGFACYLSCSGGLTIGERVLMGPYVMVYTSNHVWNPKLGTYYKQGETMAPVVIEDDVWLGAGCVILPGVTLARGTTVAAGAVVTKDTQAASIVGGVPARVLGRLEKENP